MPTLPARLYDVFAAAPGGGNVAGVVLLTTQVADPDVLRRLATDLDAPTTGLVARAAPGRFGVRFFTPTQEIPVSGHDLVGVGAALLDEGWAADGETVIFETEVGPLPADLARAAGAAGTAVVTLTQRPPEHELTDLEPETAAPALGLNPEDLDAVQPIEVASTALRHLVLPLSSAKVLDRAAPPPAALEALCKPLRCATAALVHFEAPGAQPAWRMRDFCPGLGKYEESASATTHGALGCYAARHGLCGAGSGDSFEAIGEQGVAMGRSSHAYVRLACKGRSVREVRVSGHAFCSLRRELAL